MATNLVDLAMFVFDDFKPGTYKGGEGNQLLLKAKRGGWPQTLFALHGRPLPVGPLVIYTIWSVLAIAMAQLVHLDPYGEPTLVLHVNVLGLSGSALFFLLVFRTNACYDRWWEGRKVWGAMTIAGRNFARKVLAYLLMDGDGGKRAESLVRWTIAYSVVMKQFLRDEPPGPPLAGLLSPHHLPGIESAKHAPLYVLDQMSAELVGAQRAGYIDVLDKVSLDNDLSQLVAALGGMERILLTRMPFAYIVHLRSFLVIWLMALPFTMVQYLGWAAIGACALVAYSLLGLETIGVEVEQPFGRDYCDLPIDQLCDTLTANLLEMLKRHNTAMAARGGVISRLAERGGVGGRPPVSAKLRL